MDSNQLLQRRYDIDWLRNFGILLLFPFHSARVFDYWDPFYVKSDALSWGMSWFIALTSYWFMPLLFWLAGSASWYALRKRSNTQYMKDRFYRLFIPLLFGLLFIVPPQGYIAVLHNTGETESYAAFLFRFFTDFSDLSGYFGTFTPAHLWFILYLFVLSLIALPCFSFFKKQAGKAVIEKFHHTCSRPFVFILLFFILTVTELFPAPGGQNPFYFLMLFVMGFITSSNAAYQEMFNKLRKKALLLLLFLVPVWLFLIYMNDSGSGLFPVSIVVVCLRTLNVWLTLIAILGYGNKFFNFFHRWLPYMNEAAFPVYIIHQSVLVIAAYYVLQLNFGIVPAFFIIMLLTFVVSLLLYEFMIKRTAMTRWLFGVKYKNKQPAVKPPEMKSS